MAQRFHLVTSRHEFFVQLDMAIAKTQQFIGQNPTWAMLEPIARQLEAIKKWTEYGRKPTFDERKSISMGRTVQRELQGTSDDEWYNYMRRISELASYFKIWRSDAGLNTLDENDWRTSFPNTYDLSDE
jgi:hypothetical protein